ncbi:MAG: 5-methylthioadenosine/S-adenosylhomocysteine deaminase [Myxococcota bacterium]
MRLYSDRLLLHTQDGIDIVPGRLDVMHGRVQSVHRGERSEVIERGVVDFGDKLIAPAFVNGHTHIAMGAYRGIGGRASQAGNVVEELYFKLESHATDEDFRAFARMGAWDVALTGTGAIVDQYYGGLHVAEAMRDVGLTGIVSPTLQDLAGPGASGWAEAMSITETLATDPMWAKAGIFPALGPHATDTVGDNLWGRVLTLANRLDLPVHVHVGQSLAEVERSWAVHRCSPVERLQRVGAIDADVRMLLVHMLFVSDADLGLLSPEKHTLGYCPRSQVQFAYPANIDSWRRAGLPFILGTDAGVCNDSMNVQQELRWLAGSGVYEVPFGDAHKRLRRHGDLNSARAVERHRKERFATDRAIHKPAALLDTVGRTAARLHPQFNVGSLDVGAIANICVWDLDHPAMWPATDPLRALTIGDAGPALHAMVLNGEWFGTPGYVVPSIISSELYRAHRKEAEARLAALMTRIG